MRPEGWARCSVTGAPMRRVGGGTAGLGGVQCGKLTGRGWHPHTKERGESHAV